MFTKKYFPRESTILCSSFLWFLVWNAREKRNNENKKKKTVGRRGKGMLRYREENMGGGKKEC